MDKLTALSGSAIIVEDLNIIIDQPTIKEIALVGEKRFFQVISWWNFDKEILRGKDGVEDSMLDGTSDLQWMIYNLNDKGLAQAVSVVFQLIFSKYDLGVGEDRFVFKYKGQKDAPEIIVNGENYPKLKEKLNFLFLLQIGKKEEEDRYASEAARRIAEKLKQGRDKIAQHRGEDKKESYVLLNMISGLSVSLGVPIKEILELTLYQMYNQYQRVQKKDEYDRGMQAIIAGATDVEIESWYGDLEKT